MPEFFPFIPGTETSRTARQHASEASPALGRYRAKPLRRPASQSALSLLTAGHRGSVHVGYGAIVAAGLADDSAGSDYDGSGYDDDEGDGHFGWWRRACRLLAHNVHHLWVAPRQSAVKRVVDKWWSRWGVLVVLPAASVS